MTAILPDAPAELEFFVMHNSDLGPNGHRYNREESTDIQPVAERFLQGYTQSGTYAPEDFSALAALFRPDEGSE